MSEDQQAPRFSSFKEMIDFMATEIMTALTHQDRRAHRGATPEDVEDVITELTGSFKPADWQMVISGVQTEEEAVIKVPANRADRYGLEIRLSKAICTAHPAITALLEGNEAAQLADRKRREEFHSKHTRAAVAA